MSQNTLVIADGTGAEVLTRLSEAFNTVASLNSGSAEPAETYPFMWWADTTAGLLKIRNSANTGWIEVGDLASANLGLITGSAIGTTVQAHDTDLDALSASGAGAQLASYGVNGIGFKNRIINGAMMIDQRNAGASVTPTSSGYTLDRWRAALSVASKYSVQQSTTAPSGFKNSLLVTSTSAYSVGASEVFLIQQYVEGVNFYDLNWGSSSAQSVTLSFQVRSSLTGTFGGSIRSLDGNNSYPFTYTISAANTWEQKSITISGPTSGTWATDNTTAVRLSFSLGAGSSVSGTANTWLSGDYASATGATSVVGTNGATFYITGVQLEKGSTATSFDYRPYGTELALCQRYCQALVPLGSSGYMGAGWAYNASTVHVTINLPVVMRASPTATLINGSSYYTFYAGGGSYPSSGLNLNTANPNCVDFVLNGITTATGGQAGGVQTTNTAAQAIISAEL